MRNENKPLSPFPVRGGVKVPHNKNTSQQMSEVMPPPSSVVIPMSQHIGAPCTPVVAVGDTVKVGQLIGDCDKFVSAPIHASISGTVREIIRLTMPNGSVTDAVVIDSDGKMEQIEHSALNVTNVQELASAMRQSGLVGLGGAGFPVSVKLTVPPDKKVDTLIINAAECEPYITSDHREISENSWSVMSGIFTVKELLNIHRVIIGVEENKPDAIEALCAIAYNKTHDPENEVRVMKLRSAYPQGAEKMLIQSATGRKVPAGGLPSDAGCIVMNVTSVSFIANYLKTGMPLVSRRITVDGDAVSNPKNVIVPIGTRIKDVLDFCGGLKKKPKKLLMGGPMMGIALADDSMPVLKQNNAILAFTDEARLPEETACIRCGRCVDYCPMSLMPLALAQASIKKDTDGLAFLQAPACIECGSCSFVCPAHRHILQRIRLGKVLLREATKKER